ncbi:MAG: FecR domain-containing protein [Kiritimatiellae bacterium]|nr:FecR domain-containing protein [Kiritimatiellia bacterium]
MTTQELLMLWQDNALSPGQLEELLARLEAPASRRELVDEFLTVGAIADTLSRGHGAARAPAPSRVLPFPRAAGSRRGWLTAVAAAVLLALGFAIVRRLSVIGPLDAPAAVLAVLKEANGYCVAARDGHEYQPAPGAEFGQHSTIRTAGAGSRAVVRYRDGADLTLGPDTAIAFEGEPVPLLASRGPVRRHVQMPVGRLAVDVWKLEDGEPLIFDTPHAGIIVRGTRFALSVTPTATRIDMEHGQVELVSKATGRPAIVGEGQQALVTDTVSVAARPEFGRPQALPTRVEAGLQLLYLFLEGGGRTVHDSAGRDKPLDLTIAEPDAVAWMPGGGLAVRAPTLIAADEPPARLIRACRARNEIALEAWLRPANLTQSGPARIVALSQTIMKSDFVLAQGPLGAENWGPCYTMRLNTSVPAPEGKGEMITARGAVTTSLTHLLFTRAANGAVHFYVNGRDRFGAMAHYKHDDLYTLDRMRPGDFSEWGWGYTFALANGVHRRREWLGELYLVAVYDRALSEEEVRRNFAAGLPRQASHAMRAE